MRKLLLILLSIALLGACSAPDIDMTIKEKSVRVLAVSEEQHPQMLHYLGVVYSDEIKKYAFLSGGEIEKIDVEVGDTVTPNQVMATLKSEKLAISVDNASEQQRAAQLDYAKAQKNLKFLKDLLADTKALLDAGAASQQQYDQVKLQTEIAQKEMYQAAARIEQARLQSQFSADNVDDTILRSDIDGTVLEVNYESGEIVGQGYPVVMVRSDQNTIQVGVTADDLKKIEVGDTVQISLPNDQLQTAQISRIRHIPDQGSRTYTVEIKIEDDGNLLLGETVDVAFMLSEQRGIWLPISTILNDGLDYVYIVEEGRAKRVDVTLKEIYNDKVMVEGLKANDLLVVSGVKSLAPGYKVKVLEQTAPQPAETMTTGENDE